MAKTADGKTAIRVHVHAGNTWLIRARSGTSTYLTEIRPDIAIGAYDDSVFQGINDEPISWAPARAWRLYADEIEPEARRNGIKPGWYVETPSSGALGPYSRRDDAEEALRQYAENNMGRYFAPLKNAPVKTPSGKTAEPVADVEGYWIIRDDTNWLKLVRAGNINDPSTYAPVALAIRSHDTYLEKPSWQIHYTTTDPAAKYLSQSMPYIKDTKEILAGCASHHASWEA
jgi:hypothetical protein